MSQVDSNKGFFAKIFPTLSQQIKGSISILLVLNVVTLILFALSSYFPEEKNILLIATNDQSDLKYGDFQVEVTS